MPFPTSSIDTRLAAAAVIEYVYCAKLKCMVPRPKSAGTASPAAAPLLAAPTEHFIYLN